MIFIYDTVMQPKATTFKRYGINYKLEKCFSMGDKMFYSFIHPGAEKILIVPEFAKQYHELEAKCIKFGTDKTIDECIQYIKRNINSCFVIENVLSDEASNGLTQLITVEYKDINVVLTFAYGMLTIAPEFEIRDNNIFGNGIVVSMNMDMEEIS